MAGFVPPKKNEWEKYAKYRAAIDSGDVNECARLLRVGLKAEFLKHMLARDLVALATMKNRLNIVDLLVSHGADFETQYNFRSPLDHACEKGFIEIATLLLSKGAKTDRIDVCGMKTSSLMYASQEGHAHIVELLLSKGVAIVGDFQNPLVVSCMRGHTKVVELLLASGRVDPNLTVSEMSVLTIAVVKKHLDIVKLLLVHGATIDKNILSVTTHSSIITSDSGRGLFDVLNRWPLTMLIIIFEEIGLYNKLDLLLLEDFQLFVDDDVDLNRLLALVMHFLQ